MAEDRFINSTSQGNDRALGGDEIKEKPFVEYIKKLYDKLED